MCIDIGYVGRGEEKRGRDEEREKRDQNKAYRRLW